MKKVTQLEQAFWDAVPDLLDGFQAKAVGVWQKDTFLTFHIIGDISKGYTKADTQKLEEKCLAWAAIQGMAPPKEGTGQISDDYKGSTFDFVQTYSLPIDLLETHYLRKIEEIAVEAGLSSDAVNDLKLVFQTFFKKPNRETSLLLGPPVLVTEE